MVEDGVKNPILSQFCIDDLKQSRKLMVNSMNVFDAS